MSFPLRRAATGPLLILFVRLCSAQIAGAGSAPYYTAQSVVNAATQTAEALAPNTIATIYGTGLSFTTRAVTPADIVHGAMPQNLDGVAVWMDGTPCSLFYVSPGQINFLVPYPLTAGTASLLVARDAQAGPSVSIQLNSTSPGIFVWNVNSPVAIHLNGNLISSAAPATPGEIIVLYAGGLGRTQPDTASGELASGAFPIYYASQLEVLLDGIPCPTGSVLYAGLTPGFAGLYQINLQLPPNIGSNPMIQISVGGQISPATVQLPLQ